MPSSTQTFQVESVLTFLYNWQEGRDSLGSPRLQVTELITFKGGCGRAHSTVMFPEGFSSIGFQAFQEVSITITRQNDSSLPKEKAIT